MASVSSTNHEPLARTSAAVKTMQLPMAAERAALRVSQTRICFEASAHWPPGASLVSTAFVRSCSVDDQDPEFVGSLVRPNGCRTTPKWLPHKLTCRWLPLLALLN
jgi:hypothetical protein